MRRRAIVRGGLGLLLTTAVALTGCTRDDTNDSSTGNPPPTRSAAQELIDASARLQQDTYKMTVSMTIDGRQGQLVGSMDPKKKVGVFTATVSRAGSGTDAVTEWRVIHDVLYMKTPAFEGLPDTKGKPWRRINPGTDTTGAHWYDGAQMATAFQKATNVQRVGDKAFKGTLDLAASAKAMGMPIPAASTGTTQVIPFEARIDDKGRLVRYSLDTSPGAGGAATTIVYSDFGAPVTVLPPPAEQIRSN